MPTTSFCWLVMLLTVVADVALAEDPLVIELGQIIRPSQYVTVNASILRTTGLDGMRLKANYMTVNLELGNATIIRYSDIIPFAAKGCMPTYFIADNPPHITKTVISWVAFREQWTIVIFANRVDSMERDVIDLFVRTMVVVGTFLGRGLAKEVEKKLLQREIMVIANLYPNSLLPSHSASFTGYMLLFEMLTRYSTELPNLGNLVLIDYGPDSLKCSRKPGRRFDIITHEFSGVIPVFPGVPLPKIEGDEVIHFPEHYGTHIDAPYHLNEAGYTTATLPESRTFAPCIVVHQNVSGNYQIGMNAFREWEQRAGMPIPPRSYVFVDTGNNRRWPAADEYLNIDPNTKESRYPGIDPEAARWLIQSRRVIGIGIDSISTDSSGSSKKLPTHVVLGREGIVGIENVGKADRIPNPVTEPAMNPVSKCILVHLRIHGGTGSPAAIFVHTEGFISPEFEPSISAASPVLQLEQKPQLLTTSLFLSVVSLLWQKVVC